MNQLGYLLRAVNAGLFLYLSIGDNKKNTQQACIIVTCTQRGGIKKP